MVLKEIIWPSAGNIKHTEITKDFPYKPHTKSDGLQEGIVTFSISDQVLI